MESGSRNEGENKPLGEGELKDQGRQRKKGSCWSGMAATRKQAHGCVEEAIAMEKVVRVNFFKARRRYRGFMEFFGHPL